MKVRLRDPNNQEFLGRFWDWLEGEDAHLIRSSNLPLSEEDFLILFKSWTKPYGFMFSVTVEETDFRDFAGYVAFTDWDADNGTATIHIYMDPVYRQKGLMKEALFLSYKMFFEEKRMRKINARVWESNTPSRRLCDWSGATVEGLQKGQLCIKGELVDVVLYGLTASSFKRNKSRLKEELKNGNSRSDWGRTSGGGWIGGGELLRGPGTEEIPESADAIRGSGAEAGRGEA